MIKKEQTAQWKNRLLERLAQEKGRDLVNTHISADLSLSSINDGSEKEDNNDFFPVPMKVITSMSKQSCLKTIGTISPPVAAALDRTGINDRKAVYICAATRVDNVKANGTDFKMTNPQLYKCYWC